MRRLPILPTLIVLIAVGVMIRLGFWQLDRLHQKEAMLVRYQAAQSEPLTPLGMMPRDDRLLFRRAAIFCNRVEGWQQMSGRNAAGESGIAHVATCVTGGPTIAPTVGDARVTGDIVIGWSRDLHAVNWQGGMVTGILARGAKGMPRLIADPPLAGLAANARPDPSDLPNNHLAYAVQWFLFAATATIIYGLAVRKRLAGGQSRR